MDSVSRDFQCAHVGQVLFEQPFWYLRARESSGNQGGKNNRPPTQLAPIDWPRVFGSWGTLASKILRTRLVHGMLSEFTGGLVFTIRLSHVN